MYTTNNGRTLNVTLRHYVDGVMHFEDLRAEQHILDWQVAGLQKLLRDTVKRFQPVGRYTMKDVCAEFIKMCVIIAHQVTS